MMRRGWLWGLVVFSVSVVGCPGPADPPPDGGTGAIDAPGLDAPGLDAPRFDGGSEPCVVDGDCTNGVFCDGAERCVPADPSADARGCVEPASVACLAGQTCDEAADRCVTTCTTPDADGDGFDSIDCGGTDCDDANRMRAPGRPEVCDAADLDEDCDPTTFGFRDLDADGFVDAACCNDDGAGGMTCGTDCADLQPASRPGGTEACDGFDNDCDASIDEGVLETYFVDADGDGYGVDEPSTNMAACARPTGYAVQPGDCNDDGAMGGDDIQPGAYDVCDGVIDHDCDGTVDNPPDGCGCSPATDLPRPCPLPGICSAGTQTCVLGRWDDCDVPHGTSETMCDGLDEDCDGTVDDAVSITCYADTDGDRYAGSGAPPTSLCPDPGRPMVGGCPVGYTDRAPVGPGAIDCALTDASIHPAASELCDALGIVDENCNGAINEGLTVGCFADGDNDAYASLSAMTQQVCPDASRPTLGMCPLYFTNRAPTAVANDCADNDANRSPDAMEICDVAMADEDCDMMMNEGVTITCYRDGDVDGYAATGAPMMQLCPDTAMNCPAGYTRQAPVGITTTDCNDANPTIAPGRAESCNLLDDNCNGTPDDGVLMRFYRDADNDTHGNAMSFVEACTAPGGYVGSALDCNDADANIRPGASELCNAIDDNCNSMTDEGLSQITVYVDGDGDTYGGMTTAMRCGAVPGFSLTSTDCNDANAGVHPGANDICGNGIDEDCSMGDGFPRPTWYEDVDGDGFGTNTGSVTQCAAPMTGRWVTVGGDCNDTPGFNFVYPGAPELCDGLDTDCTSVVGAGEVGNAFGLNHAMEDNDADGHGDATCVYPPSIMAAVAATVDDCNDADATVYTGATELVGNGVDNDCNGGEICFVDQDSDGFRHITTTMTIVSPNASCGEAGEGALAEPATDCVDTNALVSPAATELADNALDDNCSGAWGCYYDADNDGYSRNDGAVRDDSPNNSCADAGEGRSSEPLTDCGDSNVNVNPSRAEVADNGLDDNCSMFHGCYYDADNDGYSRSDAAIRDDSLDVDCLDSGEGTTSEPRTDCLDTNASVNPSRSEVADNALDDNCNARWGCYYDADNDGYSRSDAAIRDDSLDSDCADSGEGRVSEALTDCCDTSATTNTAQTGYFTSANACGSYDYDCSGTSSRQYLQNSSMPDCYAITSATTCGSAGVEGWSTSSDPACGASGAWVDCQWVVESPTIRYCEDIGGPRVQACR